MAKITYMPTEEVVIHQVLESDNKIIFFEDVVKQIPDERNSSYPYRQLD